MNRHTRIRGEGGGVGVESGILGKRIIILCENQ